MSGPKTILVWAAVGAAAVLPIGVAAASPLLAYRGPIYIAGGMAGVVALALLLMQPLLVGGYLPGAGGRRGRRLHAAVGIGLAAAIAVHVGGLWITSPPDMVDALLFASPTPFSAWGVIAMWALAIAAGLAALRRRAGLRPQVWRLAHTAAAVTVVIGSIAHALLIEGTMGTVSKALLCLLIAAAVTKVVADRRAWKGVGRGSGPAPR